MRATRLQQMLDTLWAGTPRADEYAYLHRKGETRCASNEGLKMKRDFAIRSWAAMLPLFAAAAVFAPHVASAEATIKIDGSSTVYPITEAVAEEFGISKRGKIHVTVGIAGTGGGFKR